MMWCILTRTQWMDAAALGKKPGTFKSLFCLATFSFVPSLSLRVKRSLQTSSGSPTWGADTLKWHTSLSAKYIVSIALFNYSNVLNLDTVSFLAATTVVCISKTPPPPEHPPVTVMSSLPSYCSAGLSVSWCVVMRSELRCQTLM